MMILEMGRVCLMTPVDITRVSFFSGDGDGERRASVSLTMAQASSRPCFLVTAFTHPLLTMIALALPPFILSTSSECVDDSSLRDLKNEAAEGELILSFVFLWLPNLCRPFSSHLLSVPSLHGLSNGQFVFVQVQVVAGEKQVGSGARESETRELSMEDCQGSVLAIHQKPLHPPTH